MPRADFMRAPGSLQLETVAIYVGKILGLDCEALHGWLRLLKGPPDAGPVAGPRNRARRGSG